MRGATALKRPGDVDSLVFLDTYGDGVEWRAYAAARMPFGPTPNASTATTATNTATKEGHQAADGSQLDGTSTGTGTGDDDEEEEEDVAAMMAYRAATCRPAGGRSSSCDCWRCLSDLACCSSSPRRTPMTTPSDSPSINVRD